MDESSLKFGPGCRRGAARLKWKETDSEWKNVPFEMKSNLFADGIIGGATSPSAEATKPPPKWILKQVKPVGWNYCYYCRRLNRSIKSPLQISIASKTERQKMLLSFS